jgi:hypothetical protein
MAFPSSRPPRPVGSQHPFRWGLSTPSGGPLPPMTGEPARAPTSSAPWALAGFAAGCVRSLTAPGVYRVPPAGDADAIGSPAAPGEDCPVDGPTPDRHIRSTDLWVRAYQPLWLVRLHEGCGCSPCDPSRLSSRPRSRCGSQTSVLFGVLHTPPLPETHDADEERQTGSPRSL